MFNSNCNWCRCSYGNVCYLVMNFSRKHTVLFWDISLNYCNIYSVSMTLVSIIDFSCAVMSITCIQ